jgi:transcriptional regulator with XRE-family HTH domain
MTEGPPTSARLRRIGRALRQIREESGYTLKAAGHRLERSGSSLSLIEKGMQALRLRDLKYILDTYEAPPDLQRALMILADQEQQPGWWDDFKDIASHADLDYASLEWNAATIDIAESSVIPGLIQTEDYAASVIRAGLPADQLTNFVPFVAYRMARQKILFTPHAPRLRLVIDEAALRRMREGRDVMRAQFDKLIRDSLQENISLYVLPFDRGTHADLIGSYQIMDIGRPPVLSAILVDHLMGRWILEDEAEITRYKAKFEHVRRAALSEEGSRKLIQRIASDL